jgi:acetylornithine/N-succinyldiaminopimelate aminotransferase
MIREPHRDARTAQDVERLYHAHVVPSYAARPFAAVSGEGCRVLDAEGRVYLDFTGGVAVNCLGHCPPVVRRALEDQAARLIHCSNLFFNEPAGRLAERLVSLTGPGKVFFCNSGAEANEALFKLARRFGHEEGRFEIITAENSFHGRTLGGISATGQEKIKKGFGPLVPGFLHVPFNDAAALEAAMGPRTAAVMMEGIQGEGGVIAAEPGYLLRVRELARERNVLLLWDGVQCGMFRTGRCHSYQRLLEGVPGGEEFLPDAVSFAKSLGAGFPVGAAWIRQPHADLLGPGSHGSTFGGNALGCAVALAVLDEIRDRRLDANIRAQGERICAGLEKLRSSGRLTVVRGCGGLIGMGVPGDLAEARERLMRAGLLLVPAGGNTLRWLPPLNVTPAEVDEALAIVENVL